MRNLSVIKGMYQGNGVTRRFAIPFEYNDTAQIFVTVTTYDDGDYTYRVLDRTEFTIDEDSVEIVYPKSADDTPISNSQYLTVWRDTDLLQLIDLTNQGAAWPDSIEGSFDKLHQIVQELAEGLSRALKVDIGDPQTPDEKLIAIQDYVLAAAESSRSASASEASAQRSAESAATSAANAAESERLAGGYADTATAAASRAEDSAISARAYNAPDYDNAKTYQAGEVVTFTDGNSYKALQETTGHEPPNIIYWQKVTDYVGDNFFEIDEYGYIVPMDSPSHSRYWRVDQNGYIVPIEGGDGGYRPDTRSLSSEYLNVTNEGYVKHLRADDVNAQEVDADEMTAEVAAFNSLTANAVNANSATFKKLSVDTIYNTIISNQVKTLPKLSNYLGINGKDSSATITDSDLAVFKTYGFSTLRYDFTWAEVEQSAGVYDFSARIALCQRLKTNGMTGYCILDYSNSVYSGYAIGSADWITAFCNVVSAYVTALKNAGITGEIFEVYNEPNINDFATKETEYVSFASAVYSAIKSIDSTAVVALPALATAEPDGKALPWFKSICRIGVLQYADVVSLHPYTVGAPEKFNFDYADGYQQSFKTYKDVITAYSIKKIPVWCGECGSDNANANLKAAYDARIILNCLANGLDKVILYTSYDDNGNFEIFNSDNTPTASATLVKSLYDELKDYAYYGVYYESTDSMILRFVNEQCKVKYVGWLIDNSSGVVYYKKDAISLTNTPAILSDITPENVADIQIDYLNTLNPYKINLGSNNVINAENTIALGEYNTARADNNLLIGNYNNAANTNNILSGINNQSLANLGIAHGEKNRVGNASLANGYGNVAVQGYGFTILSYSGNTITLDISDNLSVGDMLYIVSTDATLTKATITAINTVAITLDVTPTSTWIYAVKIGEMGRHGIITNGVECMACNVGSYAGGMFSAAYNYRTFAQGEGAVANENNSVAIGSYNSLMSGGDRFVIGNGSSHNVRSNAFRVTNAGAAYGLSAYNSSGADYAEYFEWQDGNVNNEDRVGYFVTLDNDKIRIAKSTDSYILGIVSGNASVIGNSYNDQWHGMYMRDEFGRLQYDDGVLRINPRYDNREYVSRESRKEWSAVGMLGVLPVRDDGTCEVNGYCKVADGGIATKANSGYRVIERVSDNVIKIVFR